MDKALVEPGSQPGRVKINLRRNDKGFGFAIRAYTTPGTVTFGKLVPGGAAIQHPYIQPGLRIFSINGTDTTKITRGMWGHDFLCLKKGDGDNLKRGQDRFKSRLATKCKALMV